MSGQDVDRLYELGAAITAARARYDAEVAPLIPERDQLLRTLHDGGHSYREIAALAGISWTRVRDIVLAAAT